MTYIHRVWVYMAFSILHNATSAVNSNMPNSTILQTKTTFTTWRPLTGITLPALLVWCEQRATLSIESAGANTKKRRAVLCKWTLGPFKRHIILPCEHGVNKMKEKCSNGSKNRLKKQSAWKERLAQV